MNIQVNKQHEEMMEIIVELKTAQDYVKWENKTLTNPEFTTPYENMLSEWFEVYLQHSYDTISVARYGELDQREFKEDGSIIVNLNFMYNRDVEELASRSMLNLTIEPLEVFKKGMNKLVAYLKGE